MSVRRTVCCDICDDMYTEKNPNDGFPGWGQFNGITLDGVDNPYLCPDHLKKAADFVDDMKEGYR